MAEFSLSGHRGTFVQTERKAHHEWAALAGSNPRSAQLLHILVANMDKRGVLIVSQRVLAEMLGCSLNTIKRALVPLKDKNWIDITRVGSARGGVNMYCINNRVAWADKRSNLPYAAFNARVIVSVDEQESTDPGVEQEPIRQLPMLGEIQTPSGDSPDPPNQPFLADSFVPDLPATGKDVEEGDAHLERGLPFISDD